MGKGKRSKYMTSTDFLPSEGLIVVDTCGADWIGHDGGSISLREAAVARKVSGFASVFKRRSEAGNLVFASDETLVEIAKEVDHYGGRWNLMRARMGSSRDKGSRHRMKLPFGGGDLKRIKRVAGAYSSIYEVLIENRDRYESVASVSPDDVGRFVDSKSWLAAANRSALYEALVSGNGVGLLSADVPLLESYKAGALEFELRESLICDSMRGETVRAMDWVAPKKNG